MLDKKSIKNVIEKARKLKQSPLIRLHKAGLTTAEITAQIASLPELAYYRNTIAGRTKCYQILNDIDLVDLKGNTPVNPEEGEFTETQERIQFKGKSAKIHNVEELVKAYNIDPNLWKPIKFTKKIWEMGYKDADENGQSLPLYSIHAEFKMIDGASEAKKLIEYFKKETNKLPKIHWSEVRPSNRSNNQLLELCLPDLHIGKLSHNEESEGGNYDTNIAISRFKAAVYDLIQSAPMDQVSDILFPLGNDLFNVDGYEQQTSAGTPQSEDSRWYNTFLKGSNMLKEIITDLAQNKTIHILIVQGNHDYERSFYLGEVLKAYFHNHPNVTVNNEPTLRKYHRFGNTLLGFTHGDKEKVGNLPLILATERKQDWAECEFHEFHLGHLHKEGETEINGVAIKYFSSLCSTDSWHYGRGFIGNRKMAKAILFDYDNGPVANYYHVASKTN